MIGTTASVASIVLDHPATALVFQHHGIDFCCRRQLSVERACEERGLDPALVPASSRTR